MIEPIRKLMPPIDDDDGFASHRLGRVGEMRYELEQLPGRATARLFKARLVELHESARVAILEAPGREGMNTDDLPDLL